MRRMFAGLVAALVVAAGMVALPGSSAMAGPVASPAATASVSSAAGCPYTGCIGTLTSTRSAHKVVKNHRAKICVAVRTAGNGLPQGRVTIRVTRAKGGFRFKDSRALGGQRVCFSTPRLHRRGTYVVRARFHSRAGSAYLDSAGRGSLRVVRHR